ncbi:MAG: metallophosphoesterase [Candidatus Saccharicenans sp.]|jgi:predicted MPP superfamily phosphohydrolase|nr:metallophosphoesterase [Candidatus Saccharicenans sp.]MDH7493408.1 metallophosphoesterase [Candidatus Saccharicenans sp.]
MRRSDLVIFLLIVLLIYSSVNGYILWRGLQALSGLPAARLAFILIFSSLVLAFPLGRVLNGQFRHHLAQNLTAFGSYHLALMLYLFLFLFLKDLLRWLAKIPGWRAAGDSWLSVRHPASFLIIVGLSLLVIFIGHLNAINPRLKVLELSLNKTAPAGSELKAVLISDIHLGIINRSNRLEKLVQRINDLQPDVVFFAGDIVDEAVSEEEEEKMVGLLRKIHSPLGLYACPGNHEYYGGFEKNISYLRKAGVNVLLDQAARVEGWLFVIGRKDWAAVRSGEKRLPLKEIMERDGVDRAWPVLVLDHQPLYLQEPAEAGVDIQLSGHTHAGQLFPLDIINRLVYEKNWGYLKKGQTHIYVSSGSGTWGPAVRTGSRSEIVLLKVSLAAGKEQGP